MLATYSLGELLITLADQVVTQQARLDADYVDNLRAFATVWRTAREQGLGELAGEILPSALLINQMDIEARFRCDSSMERAFALNVSLLNLGYRRRYAHSDFAESSLRLSVRRVPLSVGNEQSNGNPDPL